MSFNLFEAAVTSETEVGLAKQASADKFNAAVYDVREKLGPFLFAAKSLEEFRDRVAICKNDQSVFRIIDAHLHPGAGVLRRVVGRNGALEREFKERLAVDATPTPGGLPATSVESNPDGTSNPIAPSGVNRTLTPTDATALAPDVMGGSRLGAMTPTARRRQSTSITNPESGDTLHYDNPHTQALQHRLRGGEPIGAEEFTRADSAAPGVIGDYDTYRHHHAELEGDVDTNSTWKPHDLPTETQLKPKADFEGYKNRVDQGAESKIDKLFASREAMNYYTDWCTSNQLSPIRMSSLDTYAANLDDESYLRLANTILAWENEHHPKVPKTKLKKRDKVAAPHADTHDWYFPADADEDLVGPSHGGPPAAHDQFYPPDESYDDAAQQAHHLPIIEEGPHHQFSEHMPRAAAKPPPWESEHHPKTHKTKLPKKDKVAAQHVFARQYLAWCNQHRLAEAEPDNLRYFGQLMANTNPEGYRYVAACLRRVMQACRARYAAPDYLQKADDALTQLLNQKAEEFQETIAPLQQALITVQQAEQLQQQQSPLNVLPPAGTVGVMPGQPDSVAGQTGMPDPNAPDLSAAISALANPIGGGGAPGAGAPPGGAPDGGTGGPPPAAGGAPPGGAPPGGAPSGVIPQPADPNSQKAARRRRAQDYGGHLIGEWPNDNPPEHLYDRRKQASDPRWQGPGASHEEQHMSHGLQKDLAHEDDDWDTFPAPKPTDRHRQYVPDDDMLDDPRIWEGSSKKARGAARPRQGLRKGAPFAGYDDFDDCTSKNSDKGRPDAYCGEIKHRTEDKKANRRHDEAELYLHAPKGSPDYGPIKYEPESHFHDDVPVRSSRRRQACWPGCHENEEHVRKYHKKKEGRRKQAWSGWGPAVFPKTRQVTGWKWDNHLNGYLANKPQHFACECGSDFPTPSGFQVCGGCGKQWNSYVIGGYGGSNREASADKYLVREIPVRPDVIVANRKVAGDYDGLFEPGDDPKYWEGREDEHPNWPAHMHQMAPHEYPDPHRHEGNWLHKDQDYHYDTTGDDIPLGERARSVNESDERSRSVYQGHVQLVDPRTGAIHNLIDPGEVGEGEDPGHPTFTQPPDDWAHRSPAQGNPGQWTKKGLPV